MINISPKSTAGKVVFKQWIYQPNRSGTPRAAAGMLEYIATREGVELGALKIADELERFPRMDEQPERYIQYIATRPRVDTGGQEHGLFGKLHGMEEMGAIPDLESTRQYVERLAKKKKTIYNAVISLREEDAIQKGLTSRAAWAELANAEMPEIARKMMIPIQNLEWAAAVHMEPEHPHVHLMYWDSRQRIGVNEVNPELSNDIRIGITKDLFANELQALRKEKDRIRTGLVEQIHTADGSVLKNTRNAFVGMEVKDVLTLVRALPVNEKILNRRVANGQCAALLGKLLELDAALREEYPSGAIKYKYMPDTLKSQLDTITNDILKGNPDIAREYKHYMDTVQEQAEIFGGNKNINSYRDKAKRDVYAEIGNKILSTVRELRGIRYAAQKAEWEAKQTEQKMLNITLSLFQSVLNLILSTPAPRHNSSSAKGDLDRTQAEKADMRRRHDDTTMEWGD